MRLLFYCADNFQLLDLSGPADVFAIANILSEVEHFTMQYVSEFGGRLRSNSGVEVETSSINDVIVDERDVLFVINGLDVERLPSPAVVRFLDEAHDRASSVCTICTGLFILAAALRHMPYKATTHWRYFDALRSKFPNIELHPNAPFVNDGKLWSSAGISTAIDMSLHLLEQHCGRRLAQQVTMAMVLPNRRRQNDAQLSFHLLLQFECSDTKWENLLHWIQENIATPLDTEKMASFMAMSPRNFTRRCKQEFDITPKKLVDRIRLELANSLLQETAYSLSYIANRCGYGREENMKRAFLKGKGMTPFALRRLVRGSS
ncbi:MULTISPECIES: GlxA family transcriptional regulator [Vibrio]|uniref:GlxA family transcriptional regulator n=1 Tax=Vibrio TaxID=662 RepID=UPI001268DF9B|nr:MULTISPECIES: DJ-1/PfpI family protein [Vibrio]MCM5510018.1 DJ-1/PfpI family protein [Vibrio sp. SCSIO 43169]NOI30439.1 helix-turn-helix domain-containing protein [Vibrio coralliilyticus]NOI50027.1 helix-turn-helix domain-containing protein [Vibrio coralliilyticus]QFT39921.1 HTH-type transcriptional regulator CdhR [Vibrio sp. THAF64]QGM37572.1 HTH-type transcriptional regulator CdhR [Vibrio sp. THAF191d]